MKGNDTLVSVVIPTYARKTTLKRAINSVLAQTYKNLEIIVVDDNPPDSEWRASTQQIMGQYANNPRIRYIQNVKNMGGSGARNEGIKAAQGEYIAFLDDDDEYFPEKVEKQLECFLTTDLKKLALVFCDSVMTYDNDKFVCYVRPRYKGCCLYEAMANNCLAATSQWLARKKALLDVGMFTVVPCKQDSTLILKLLSKGYEVDCVPEVLSKYCNYQGERISDTGEKNLRGELLYQEKCKDLYSRLTEQQIKEVEYTFATRLYKLYKANGKKEESKKCLLLMLKTHFVETNKRFVINWARTIKQKVGGGITSQSIYKNVLHIANYQASYKGNFIASLESLSDRLANDGANSVYAFPRQEDSGVAINWIEELRDNGSRVYQFTNNVSYNIRLINDIIKKENIGIIHTHFISMKQYLPIFICTLFSQRKIVMHFHNHSVKAYGIKNLLRQMLYKKCIMIGCSQSVYENLCRDYPKNKKYAVNNGIQFKRLENITAAGRKEYGLKNNSIVCLIFGFDFYRKGVDLAVKALNELNKTAEKYELLISLSKNFDYVEQETKKILGNIPEWIHIIQARPDVAALYKLCDLFLSPSREEGLPYSVLEAGYCECGVVISNIPAQARLEIPYAVLHDPENYLSLGEKIKEALQTKEEKRRKMQEVCTYMQSRYSLDQWVDGVLKVYKAEQEGAFVGR